MKAKTLSMTISLFLMISIGWAQPINFNASALKLVPETSFLPNAKKIWERQYKHCRKFATIISN